MHLFTELLTHFAGFQFSTNQLILNVERPTLGGLQPEE